MLDQLFLHLAQYADEIKNSSNPSIECLLFKSLEKIQISQTNEPSLTAEYRTSSHIDFSPPIASNSTQGDYSSSKFSTEGLDPVDCLRYSSEFHFPQDSPESTSSPSLFPFDFAHDANECDSVGSPAGSSVFASSEETDPFCISSPEHSRVSSDNGGAEWASQFKSFNPFADPLFYLPYRPMGDSIGHAMRFSRIWELPHSRMVMSNGREADWMPPNHKFLSAEPTSRIPSMDAAGIIPPTNVFVANFPSHWSKSDLWDLFEGIPVTTVHVLPEKRGSNEESIYGGTGFVNITRASDAHALLAMLDKKIWLIDGSALKFRLANSCPPTEPMNFHVHKKNRTVRRHQHKVIDRLRAEQTVGNKQLACCDRHQLVVYQNISSRKTAPALSVVHGSRQRNTQFVCNAAENSLAKSGAPRPFLEFLKSYLNRRNNYNSQQILASSFMKQNPAKGLSPVPLLQVASKPVDHERSVVNKTDTKPIMSAPSVTYFGGVDIPRRIDFVPQTIAYAPSATYYAWAPDAHANIPVYIPANVPSLSLRWIPTNSPYSPAPFSQLPQGREPSAVFFPRMR
ncbi:hypothetical protein PTTG_02990 [Puccinia triticina 1-1 BBBD Race 1]|uniref:RRM domain-containing protein n=1 Tax=Puccinia triticina (isolate 1-1 / race 1 (BBBD)) TaxID=630390 RepID=A0A0C4EQD2_PUCT1|nr:hypothetical protein PTTG_02990 [Puccinia triticina 1-1 BBBD Race 1]